MMILLGLVGFAAAACLTPVDNLTINVSSTLCGGVYQINDTGADGVIRINAGNLILDCNNTAIVGNKNGRGINTVSNFNNMTIKNCNVSDYAFNIRGTMFNTTIKDSSTRGGYSVYSLGPINMYLNNITSTNASFYLQGFIGGSLINNTFVCPNSWNNSQGASGIWNAGPDAYNVTRCGSRQEAIYLNKAWNTTVEQNTIIGGAFGIRLDQEQDNVTIRGNTIKNNDQGIELKHILNRTSRPAVTIVGNTFRNNTNAADYYLLDIIGWNL